MPRLATLLILAAVHAAYPVSADEPRVVTPDGLLIEMEHHDVRQPDDGSFAIDSRERAASNRTTLSRFFLDGQVRYRFTVPDDGVYHVWMRYGSKGKVRLRYSLGPRTTGPTTKFAMVDLPATGGYIGPDVWHWAPLLKRRLDAGVYTLTIGSASFRPDCLYLSPNDEPPTDDLVQASYRVNLDSATQALVDRPLVDASPDWLTGAEDYQLPAWFEEYRVHAHTRLSLAHLERDVFFNAADGFRKMGVPVFARHIKTGDEGAWWPSKVGSVDPRTEGRNVAKQIIDNAHAQGQRILIYHRHMEDAFMAELHPDWVCRDAKGEPLSSKRGAYMCFNSSYPEYLLTRSLELADLGADGFYYDEVHMPKTGCWCEYCRAAFKKQSGLEHPRSVNPDDPVWHKLLDFNNLTIERTFATWRAALHRRHPELVMLIGSNTWPTMCDRHLTNRLFRIADAMKTEFSLPARTPTSLLYSMPPTMPAPDRDVKLALGYTLARDSAGGRPAHIWCHGLLDATSALYATAGMVTHGCIANLDVSEPTIPNMMFAPAFALGRRVSPHFAGLRPVRFAAVHYPEAARDKYRLNPDQAWEQVLYPMYGVYRTLLRERVPVGLVTDSQLTDGLLDGYRVLVLPTPHGLTPAMEDAVRMFEASGGLVVRQQSDWQWHLPDGGLEEASSSFMSAIVPAIDHARVRVDGGPEKMHAVAFGSETESRLTVSLANDFSWVYTGRAPDKEVAAELPNPPPPCRDVTVFVNGRKKPVRVFDAVSGRTLRWVTTDQGIEIDVPEFETMAVIVLEFQ